MATAVVAGATVQCTMGLAPGQLLVTSQAMVLAGGMPAATIADAAPITNVTPCGMCTSLLNPQVAAATAAALGVLTPMPCVPAPVGIWSCAGTPLVGGDVYKRQYLSSPTKFKNNIYIPEDYATEQFGVQCRSVAGTGLAVVLDEKTEAAASDLLTALLAG